MTQDSACVTILAESASVPILAAALSAVIGAVAGWALTLFQTRQQRREARQDRTAAAGLLEKQLTADQGLARYQATSSATRDLLRALYDCDVALHDGLSKTAPFAPERPKRDADGRLTDAEVKRIEFGLHAARGLSAVLVTSAPMFPYEGLRDMLSSAVEYAAKVGLVVLEKPSPELLTRTKGDISAYFRFLRWCVGRYAEEGHTERNRLPTPAKHPDSTRAGAAVWAPPDEQQPPNWA